MTQILLAAGLLLGLLASVHAKNASMDHVQRFLPLLLLNGALCIAARLRRRPAWLATAPT